ncbi:Ig-like domain-containing protein [Reichenbachiella sp.]|uniref:Ig-like domain-containing protein n=1 Tax=Reichenbachiella sp. TaxID=2184521 RepID=UPI003B5C7E72
MKTILNIAIVALLTLTIVSCKDDLPAGEGIPQIYVTGATTALPTDVEEYSVGDAGSATWTVSDAAVASISGSGSTASVTFLSPGDVRVTATVGSQTGYVDVRVSSIDAGVTVSYDSYGFLSKDSTGTVTFTFDAPLASAPLFGLKGTSDAKLITVGTLAGSADKYTVGVTGGEGNGTAMAYLRDVIVTDAFGGDKADTLEVAMHTTDNTAPAMETFDQMAAGAVSWGMDVSATISFNEAVRAAMTDAADTAIWVYYGYTRDMVAGATAKEDSVELVSEDMITWTATLTVPDSISHGNGFNYVKTGGEFLDLAGNEVAVGVAASLGSFTIDREGPNVPTTTAMEPTTMPEGVGNQRWVTLGAASTDVGLAGVAGYHYLLKEAYESDTTATGVHNAGPKSLADFSSELNESETMSKLMSTDSARYDLFWIAVDELGNASDIDSARLQYNKNGEFSYNVDNTIP